MVHYKVPNADCIELLEFRQRRNSYRLKQLLEDEGISYTFKSDEILDWRESENMVREKDGRDKKKMGHEKSGLAGD